MEFDIYVVRLFLAFGEVVNLECWSTFEIPPKKYLWLSWKKRMTGAKNMVKKKKKKTATKQYDGNANIFIFLTTINLLFQANLLLN